jgi:uncharacterized protein YheU (UPF0270 family)
MKIPAKRLSADVLNAVIDSFVLREGTDYGHAEQTLEAKRAAVRGQIERGEAEITFDANTGSVDIRPVVR